MTLTAKDVAEILRLLEQSSLESLSLEMNGVKLNLQRGSAVPVRQPAAASPAPQAAVEPQPQAARPVQRKVKLCVRTGTRGGRLSLLGIFYRAPKPGEPPFVEVGSKVVEDTVVGIIEVMKLMNSVRAGVKGEVVEILAENEALVEYDEILLRVRPRA